MLLPPKPDNYLPKVRSGFSSQREEKPWTSLSSRLRFFGNTPNAARNILEDIGLLVFVACMLPPFAVWVVGYHLMKINPAVSMGGMAGARSHSGPCQEAATEIGSNVPWVGFPVAFAVSGILLTVLGYFAMVFAN